MACTCGHARLLVACCSRRPRSSGRVHDIREGAWHPRSLAESSKLKPRGVVIQSVRQHDPTWGAGVTTMAARFGLAMGTRDYWVVFRAALALPRGSICRGHGQYSPGNAVLVFDDPVTVPRAAVPAPPACALLFRPWFLVRDHLRACGPRTAARCEQTREPTLRLF